MVISPTGNIGIGTDNPYSALVDCTSCTSNNSVSDTKIIIESTELTHIPKLSFLRIINDVRTYDLGIDGATDALRFYDVTAAAERLRVGSNW